MSGRQETGETMRHERFSLITAVVLLFVPTLVEAQQRGAGTPQATLPAIAPVRATPVAVAPMTHIPARSVVPGVPVHAGGHAILPAAHPLAPRVAGRPVAPKAPTQAHPIQASPSHLHGPSGVSGRMAEGGNGIPGLGFDYPHYAATHPNAGHHHFHGGAVFPFMGGGIYIPSFGYVEGSAPPEGTAEAQPAETQDATAENVEPGPAEQPVVAPQVRSRSNSNPPPASEYIFVRRDGTVFFAVAYSWVNGNLQYVTQDGFRKLVSTTSLDLDATMKFNEQRGVFFHSPA
jgi:hypothetical protein